jgi:hypothetical protein
MVIEIVAAAGLAAAALQVGLMVRPVGLKRDDPAKLGHPMAGPASRAEAHFALSRQRPANRPKFRT